MVILSFGPAAIGAALSGRWELWILVPQVPVYLFSLWSAIRGLNGMLVRTAAAERENDRRASHDQLTGLVNRAGLERAITAWQHREDRRGPLAFFYLDLVASRRSTIVMATRRATRCCAWSRGACRRLPRSAALQHGSAATSSCCSCPRPIAAARWAAPSA
jgi:hypothetical protein